MPDERHKGGIVIDKASRKGSRYTCRHCGSSMHADVNASINIRDNYITRVMQSGQAAVNQPYGWGATGKPETESVDKTLTCNPGRLQSISRMDGVPQVNRKRNLWIKRSCPSLQACLKGVDWLEFIYE